jgi:hypothetical protein
VRSHPSPDLGTSRTVCPAGLIRRGAV